MCVKIHPDAHTAQYIRCCTGEKFTIIPGVIPNNHTAVFACLCAIGIQQIPAKTHCRFTYGVHVHAIGAGAHHTPQSTRAKLKVAIETILDFFFIFYCFKFLTSYLIEERIIQPLFVPFFIVYSL